MKLPSPKKEVDHLSESSINSVYSDKDNQRSELNKKFKELLLQKKSVKSSRSVPKSLTARYEPPKSLINLASADFLATMTKLPEPTTLKPPAAIVDKLQPSKSGN